MVTVAASDNYTDESRRMQQALLDGEPGTENGGLWANKPGYHGKRKDLMVGDYSIRAAIDKLGPNDKSAAHDWSFPEAWGPGGDHRRISKYMRRVRVAWLARDPRLKGWREVLGCIDNQLIAFDFDSWSTRTPDPSHYGHMHLSEHRAFVGSWDNKVKMLEVLGLSAPEGDDMFCKYGDKGTGKVWVLQRELNRLGVGAPIGEDDHYGDGTAAKMVEVGLAGSGGKGHDYWAGEYDALQQRLRDAAAGAPGPAGPAGPKGDKGDAAEVPDGSLLRLVAAPDTD